MLTKNSEGVEISITGGVVEMVRDQNLVLLFLLFFFFFISFFIYNVLIISRYKKLRILLAKERRKA